MTHSPSIRPLPDLMLEPLVRAGLMEDLGRGGDLTTDVTLGAGDVQAHAVLSARQAGVVAGLDMARLSFCLMDPRIEFTVAAPDGTHVTPGQVIASVRGPARGILSGERVALNFVSHLCGIATATAQVVAAVEPYGTRVSCTRKTLPGMRAIQKYAVRAGGGANHRFGLDDAILIKDNHLAIAGGIRPALTRARAAAGHLVSIELEVDTLEQLAEGLEVGGVDVFLLDNMTPDQLRQAVAMIDHRAVAEASGGVTPQNAATVAATGVDLISMGWLTHSVRAMDIGLDYQP
ncbi:MULTISPECIES: carboxylating nicotinate-nucleotide diphosphorylase [Novacetimonas]|uniref:nicotinate-nucleotide diphosphorylase (carboxylating) n=2 Tax=Novacetimonas hansenii TaxID=436 RepID=A0ABQ0SDH4_NOVHA|nr:carboxylating nicotinate-nucleotide diphosphorylase [Novacetimonas hansenii]EFG85261.1 nicotinate-nucleotide pyrophosphorylase [Novacetimonas hansenii ATCC 23769]PYD71991.1 nicotinate-nucleotide diphosphorylase (carboxylating) [Novacetimonas hansenii]WEQ60176.1 carboxylating nicotinate-nucleotide diphosphorylase [Novacetimonas hansenii]CUW46474.1 putative nicotinate-nucleotide pyrophosphorylase [carboxylating] [Novacetimonas hansenii]GAN82677.1 nicotinate-nucleotide pyrophosphorylase [Novac